MSKSEALGYADYRPLLDRFVEALSHTFGEDLVSVVLYGSVARGTARPTSDIDLLIVLDNARESYLERLDPISAMQTRPLMTLNLCCPKSRQS